jgi:hypothetical protein
MPRDASNEERLAEFRREFTQTAQELHDKVMEVDPNLVVHLSFGERRQAAKALGDAAILKMADDDESFPLKWPNDGHFGDCFGKTGDGFVNWGYVTAESEQI